MAEDAFVPGEKAKLDLDSLEGLKSGTSSALARESLYVKFDPFVGSPQGGKPSAAAAAQAAAAQADPGTPQPASSKLLDFDTPKASSPVTHVPLDADLLTGDGSPTITRKLTSEPTTPTLSRKGGGLRYTEADLQRKIQEAVKQTNEEAAILQMEIDDLQTKLAAEQANSAQMAQVVDEYGQAMAKMIESQESSQSGVDSKLQKLVKDKEQAEIDLAKTESAFSDVHRKYEKTKELVANYKGNEEKLRAGLETAQKGLEAAEARYDALKAHAEQKIQEANEEINKVREQNKSQISVQNAKLKKLEIETGQLQRQVESKTKDNAELTAICDDLVKQLDALSGS